MSVRCSLWTLHSLKRIDSIFLCLASSYICYKYDLQAILLYSE